MSKFSVEVASFLGQDLVFCFKCEFLEDGQLAPRVSLWMSA